MHAYPFRSVPPQKFGTAAKLADYLEKEKEFWVKLRGNLSVQFPSSVGNQTANYDEAIGRARTGFYDSALDRDWSPSELVLLFPPSHSELGHIAAQLWEAGYPDLFAAVIAAFWEKENRLFHRSGAQSNTETMGVLSTGKALLAASVLLTKKSARRSVDAELDARLTRADAMAAELETRFEQLDSDVVAFRAKLDEIDSQERQGRVALEETTEAWYQQLMETWKARTIAQEQDWVGLRNLFFNQLKLKAPAELWQAAEKVHKSAERRALALFVVLTLATVAAVVAVIVCYGDAIARSFVQEICDTSDPPECRTAFSPLGPIIAGAILLTTSLAVWLLKLVSKIYLSERHLALNAQERRAFTEVYLAMSNEAQVPDEQVAIVLASLFRPSQDGYVKDDGGSFDISAAAVLAKLMAKP